MNRLSEEMKLIPRSAWACAVAVCLALPLVIFVFWASSDRRHHGVLGLMPAELLIFLPILIVFFFYILLVGYIAADARRRGMRPVLWVLLAIFIPNAIGIVLYFILRKPLLRACPQCGAAADATYAFCSSCGATLGETCPSCRIAVEPGWSHCPKCGSSLRTAPAH